MISNVEFIKENIVSEEINTLSEYMLNKRNSMPSFNSSLWQDAHFQSAAFGRQFFEEFCWEEYLKKIFYNLDFKIANLNFNGVDYSHDGPGVVIDDKFYYDFNSPEHLVLVRKAGDLFFGINSINEICNEEDIYHFIIKNIDRVFLNDEYIVHNGTMVRIDLYFIHISTLFEYHAMHEYSE